MPRYMIVDVDKLEGDLREVANIIKGKSGTIGDLKFPEGFKDAAELIESPAEWKEDNSEIVYEATCYNNAGISCYITKNGTLSYKRNNSNTPEHYPNWNTNTLQTVISNLGDKTKYRVSVKQAEIINESDRDPITKIGQAVFSAMPELRVVKIPDTITEIGTASFIETASLRSIDLPDSISAIGSQAFKGSGITRFRIPQSTTSLPSACFNGCSLLKDIIGIERLTDIGSSCFTACGLLQGTIVFGENINTIGTSAFSYCASLDKLIFRGIPTSIASTSFGSCPGIKDIYVPWSEGEVANAPWGATNATIHYNTTYDDNGNPIEEVSTNAEG